MSVVEKLESMGPTASNAALLGAKTVTSFESLGADPALAFLTALERAVKLAAAAVPGSLRGIVSTVSMMWMTPLS